jgi:hypothetical protein
LPGDTIIWVSQNGTDFFKLDVALAPPVDALLPTDGAGNFFHPANPALQASDFTGKNLSEIRLMYGGSGGGSSYDIGWARDTDGNPVQLANISYVKIDVLNGVAEIDAIGPAIVPEPGTFSLIFLGLGGVLLAAHKKFRPVR